jgi:1-acyl-sn-glycerol-3-phosphate acyltransferase
MRKKFHRFAQWLVHFVLAMIWRIEVRGQENIPPTGAVIIASNHRSFGDPPIVGSSIPRAVHFLAKKELFDFRPFGWLISNLNAHPLNRGGDVAAFKLAQNLLSQGEALIIFPEGGRSKTDEFRPAKPGVGMLAQMAECPIVPTYVHNSAYMKKLKKIRVVFGPPVFAKGHESYQDVAEAVMRQIGELKKTVTQIPG